MMNVKNHHIFTDKFVLSVVDLKHIELATQKDKQWEVNYWASLFKATTWEELKMLAEQNPIMNDAVETIYELTADESIREQCKAREKHIREMNTVLKEREMAVKSRDEAFKSRDEAVKSRDEMFQRLDEALQSRDEAFKQVEQLLQENRRLKEQQSLNTKP